MQQKTSYWGTIGLICSYLAKSANKSLSYSGTPNSSKKKKKNTEQTSKSPFKKGLHNLGYVDMTLERKKQTSLFD